MKHRESAYLKDWNVHVLSIHFDCNVIEYVLCYVMLCCIMFCYDMTSHYSTKHPILSYPIPSHLISYHHNNNLPAVCFRLRPSPPEFFVQIIHEKKVRFKGLRILNFVIYRYCCVRRFDVCSVLRCKINGFDR